MIARCQNPKTDAYRHYGGRGIKVCDRWGKSFVNFMQDVGRRPTKYHTIERKNNDGDYCPENCIWATKKEQARNRRNNRMIECGGIIMTLAEWAEVTGLRHQIICDRLDRKGLSVERALTLPYRRKPRRKADVA